MTRLETQRVSSASAEQRRGRAGRLRPGSCYRLWSQEQQLIAQSPAEILHADLAPLLLELAQWGSNADELNWLDPPPAAHLNQARDLLLQLAAIDANGALTKQGKQLLQFGAHPRLATMMLHAKAMGQGQLGCQLAALLSERDPLSSRSQGADLRQRLLLLNSSRYSKEPSLQRINQSAQRWCRQLGIGTKHTPKSKFDNIDVDQAGLLLAFAFPDRIAQRRGLSSHASETNNSRQYQLSNGKGAEFRDVDTLSEHNYLVCAELDGHNRNARIYLAAPVKLEQLRHHYADRLLSKDNIGWDSNTGSVRGHRECWLGQLRLEQRPLTELNEQQCIDGLLAGITQQGLGCLPWNSASRTLQQQVELMRQLDSRSDWPDLSDSQLQATIDSWLAPYLRGVKRLNQLKSLNLKEVLSAKLSWEQQQQLTRQLPTHIKVPSGSNVRIDYSNPQQPVLAVRLQELFGWQQSPSLIEGKLTLTLHLLSPAQRPIQVTRDLASFWDTTYAEVCKDLKGRYPKHYWPDNPREAVATRGTKKWMERQQKG